MGVITAVNLSLHRTEGCQVGRLETPKPVGSDVGNIDVQDPAVEYARFPPFQRELGDQQRRLPVLRLAGRDGDRNSRNSVRRRRQRSAHRARMQGSFTGVRAQVHAREHQVRHLAERTVGGQKRDQGRCRFHTHAFNTRGHVGRMGVNERDLAVDLLPGQGRTGTRVLLGGRGYLDPVPPVQGGLGENRETRGCNAVVVGHKDAHGPMLPRRPLAHQSRARLGQFPNGDLPRELLDGRAITRA